MRFGSCLSLNYGNSERTGTIDRFQYLLLLAACALSTLPLEVVFAARVWRQPARLLRALAAPAALFVAWDAVAIARDHWWFEARYVTGWRLPAGVPVEELAFFVVVPVCTLLTFEAVRHVLRGAQVKVDA